MVKNEIFKVLKSNHETFLNMVANLPQESLLQSIDGKWSPAAQVNHIILSVRPLRKALQLPKFLLRLFFGKSNREGKSYENLVKRYREKLNAGGKAPASFVPAVTEPVSLESMRMELLDEIQKVCSLLDRFSEQEMDHYILPHPLLGKLTLREMMYFTMYHVTHHGHSITDQFQLK